MAVVVRVTLDLESEGGGRGIPATEAIDGLVNWVSVFIEADDVSL